MASILTQAEQSHMKELVERYIETSSISTGLINAEQASSFIDTMRDQSKVAKLAQFYKMEASTRNIDSLGIAAEQLRKKTEGLAPETWATITAGQNVLTSVMCIFPVAITYETLNRNIEKQALESTIDRMAAKAVMNDIEKVAWVGDGSTGSFLSINVGLIELAEAGGNKVSTSGSTDDKANLALLVDALPEKWHDEEGCRIFMNSADARRYGRQIAARNDGLLYLLGRQPLQFEGYEIVPSPFITSGVYILTPALNIAYGVELNMMIKRAEDIDRGIVKMNFYIAWDVNFAVNDAVAIAYNY